MIQDPNKGKLVKEILETNYGEDINHIGEVVKGIKTALKISLPIINDNFDVKKALGDKVFMELKQYISERESYKLISANYVLDDLNKYTAKHVEGDIDRYFLDSIKYMDKLIYVYTKLENDGKKVLKTYKSQKKFLNKLHISVPNEGKIDDYLSDITEMYNYVLDIRTKLDTFKKYLDKFDFTDFINYFFEISGITVDELNSKLCTLDEKDFNYLVNKVLNLDLYKTLKLDIIFVLIIMRNSLMVYLPFVDNIYGYVSKAKKNEPILEKHIAILKLVESESDIDIDNFGDYIYLLWVALYSLKKEVVWVDKIIEIGKDIGVDNIYDLYISNEKSGLLEQIYNLYNNGLLVKLKDYLDINPKGFAKYIDFVSSRFFQEYPGMIEFIDISDLDLYNDKIIKGSNLSNIEKAFAIENGFLGYKDKYIKKLLFLYENTELEIEDFKKITNPELIDVLESYYLLPTIYLKRIINGEKVEKILKLVELEKYKLSLEKKLSLIPVIDGFVPILNKIREELDNINVDNFVTLKKKIDQIFNQNLKSVYSKIKELLSYEKLSLNEINIIINSFLGKSTKKNGIRLSVVLDILKYLFEKYDSDEILFIKEILLKRDLVITNYFTENYETVISTILSNTNLIEEIVSKDKKITFSDIYNLITSKNSMEYTLGIINVYFPRELEQEVLEFSLKNRDLFNKLVTISKILNLKNNLDFTLELITSSATVFKKYYFLVKNLNVIGVSLEDKYEKIFQLVLEGFLNESKIKELKVILKGGLNEDIDKGFFYSIFLDYISGNESLDIFKLFFSSRETDIEENNNTFEKNKGIKGLSGFNGEEVLRKLKKLGFEVKRTNGSHYILYNSSTKKYVLLAYHNKIKAKTLFDTLNRAEIKKDTFLEA